MQIFFVKSLDGEYYDFRMDFHTDKGGKERTVDVALWESYCAEYEALPEITDCAVAAGKQVSSRAGDSALETLLPVQGGGRFFSQIEKQFATGLRFRTNLPFY